MSREASIRALRADVDRRERELRAAVADLEDAARRGLRPERWIREHPWLAVSGAFLLGRWLGRR